VPLPKENCSALFGDFWRYGTIAVAVVIVVVVVVVVVVKEKGTQSKKRGVAI